MRRFDPTEIGGNKLHQLLLGSIAPRPIALVSSINEQGQPNLSPFSFFNAFGVNPSTLIFSPNRRNRDASVKHTYLNVKSIPEVVINVVDWNIVQQTSLASTEYSEGINEFVKSGLTMLSSEVVRPFRVAESPVQYECRVREVVETGQNPGSANLVVCEVVMAHVREDILDEKGAIDPQKARMVGRMGGDYYVKAFGDSLFKVAKPIDRKGIGVDALPENIRLSTVLTGNHLGQLGNLEHLPTEDDLNHKEIKDVALSLKSQSPDTTGFLKALHSLAAQYIESGEVYKGLCLLMANQL